MTTYYVDAVVGSDSNAGTAEGSGNAWQTIQKAANTISSGDKVWVKASADYTEQVTLATSMTELTVFEGYSSTVGDGGQAVIEASNSRSFCVQAGGKNHYCFKNFIMQGATSKTLDMNATGGVCQYWVFVNCIFQPDTGSGTKAGNLMRSAYFVFYECIFRNFSSDGISFYDSPNTFVGCVFSNNGRHGISPDSGTTTVYATKCIFAGNASNGIKTVRGSANFCTFADNGNGVEATTIADVSGCVISGHNGVSAFGTKKCRTFNSFFYDNTTDQADIGVGFVGADIRNTTLSTDPFTDSASGDYTILSNSSAYQGASFVAGYTDYQDAGALQHQDPAGGGGSTVHPLYAN